MEKQTHLGKVLLVVSKDMMQSYKLQMAALTFIKDDTTLPFSKYIFIWAIQAMYSTPNL